MQLIAFFCLLGCTVTAYWIWVLLGSTPEILKDLKSQYEWITLHKARGPVLHWTKFLLVPVRIFPERRMCDQRVRSEHCFQVCAMLPCSSCPLVMQTVPVTAFWGCGPFIFLGWVWLSVITYLPASSTSAGINVLPGLPCPSLYRDMSQFVHVRSRVPERYIWKRGNFRRKM